MFLELVSNFYFWIVDWELGYSYSRVWDFLKRSGSGESTCIYSVKIFSYYAKRKKRLKVLCNGLSEGLSSAS